MAKYRFIIDIAFTTKLAFNGTCVQLQRNPSHLHAATTTKFIRFGAIAPSSVSPSVSPYRTDSFDGDNGLRWRDDADVYAVHVLTRNSPIVSTPSGWNVSIAFGTCAIRQHSNLQAGKYHRANSRIHKLTLYGVWVKYNTQKNLHSHPLKNSPVHPLTPLKTVSVISCTQSPP